jgi:hypothetical protein
MWEPRHFTTQQASISPPPIFARQWLGKNIPVAANTTIEDMLDALILLWSMSYKSRGCLSVYPLSLLGNGLVNMFLCQQRTIGGIISYIVRVISKKVGEQFFPELLVF